MVDIYLYGTETGSQRGKGKLLKLYLKITHITSLTTFVVWQRWRCCEEVIATGALCSYQYLFFSLCKCSKVGVNKLMLHSFFSEDHAFP